MTPDGMEVRDYVNGGTYARCAGGGAAAACLATQAACHNIFFIKNGVVIRYAPTGAGGARCYTDDTLRPGR
jgi:hypothetical protein